MAKFRYYKGNGKWTEWSDEPMKTEHFELKSIEAKKLIAVGNKTLRVYGRKTKIAVFQIKEPLRAHCEDCGTPILIEYAKCEDCEEKE